MTETARMRTPALQWVAMAAVAVVALLLRLAYVQLAVVDNPFRGDTVQYARYAWNLIEHHTFSMTIPTAETIAPDSFRDPGYPALLALVGSVTGLGQPFYQAMLVIHCLLSAATAFMLMVLARRWLGFAAAMIVGVVFAFWPHTITMCSFVLSETLVGTLVTGALLLVDTALRKDGYAWYLAAGLAFALAALTNSVVLPFAPLLGMVMVWRDASRRRFWIAFALMSILPASAWAVRNAALPEAQSSGDRAMMNLVQGAWPEYHAASAARFAGDPAGTAIMQAIDAEYAAIHRDRVAGLEALGSRLASQPRRTIGWYLSKPTQLWGWSVGIGQRDVYVFETYNSPLLTQPAWRAITDVLFVLNPVVMLLAAVGALVALSRKRAPSGLRIAAALGCFLTLVFTVLQADARYSTPYRGLEILLAVHAGTLAAGWLRSRRRQNATQRMDA